MSSRVIQLLLIVGTCIITLYFSTQLAVGAVQYFSLKSEAKAKVSQWEIIPIKDRFALKAIYGFEAQNKSWRGVFTLNPPYYLNEMAAINALREKAKESWTAWYDPKAPQTSALEKKFNFSLLFRVVVCCGVLIYFFYLSKRLARV